MATAIHALDESDAKTISTSHVDEFSVADAHFLATLGKRIRKLRDQRGMTRKALAREAAVSERYLGQVESGDGNASILLLRHLSAALNVPLGQLLTLDQEGLDARYRIALIGLRGAGKTTLGSLLAHELHTPFIELDREIEKDTGLPLSEIFTLYGQAGYRRIERRCLERALNEHEHAVFAVGGGIVSEQETFSFLLARCYTVWLKAQPEEHMARVLAQGDLRPMAGNKEAMEDLKHILTTREPFYSKANSTVDTSGRTVEESLIALQQTVKSRTIGKGGASWVPQLKQR
jgi:XRE family aerobic/anaerobic benzoate catabolism transcriptional regulator